MGRFPGRGLEGGGTGLCLGGLGKTSPEVQARWEPAIEGEFPTLLHPGRGPSMCKAWGLGRRARYGRKACAVLECELGFEEQGGSEVVIHFPCLPTP